jgi:uncharacterized membrane protein
MHRAPLHNEDQLSMASGIALHHFRLGLVLVGVLLVGAFASISPALADLRICNETANPVSIALGYRVARGWQSEGWWVANPSQCATVYQGDLSSRYYYLYVADDVGGGAWDGSVFMCTRDETFTIFGVEDCLARGYERTGFFEVDTKGQQEWTLQLTEGAGDNGGSDVVAGDEIADPTPLDDSGAVVDDAVPADAVPADAVPADAVPGDSPANQPTEGVDQ